MPPRFEPSCVVFKLTCSGRHVFFFFLLPSPRRCLSFFAFNSEPNNRLHAVLGCFMGSFMGKKHSEIVSNSGGDFLVSSAGGGVRFSS